MGTLLRGVAWGLAALVFGAAGFALVLIATVLGCALDWALTIVFWILVGSMKGALWLIRPKRSPEQWVRRSPMQR